MEIQEVLRLLRQGASDRETARLLRLNRRTVIRYRQWAADQGLLEGELPNAQELDARLAATLPGVVPPQQTSTVERYRAEIAAYRAQGVELAAIRARLEEIHG